MDDMEGVCGIGLAKSIDWLALNVDGFWRKRAVSA